MPSELMKILIDCENLLGWYPGPDYIRERAIQHAILTRVIAKRNYSVRDLRLALDYCHGKRQPISRPTDLVGYVLTARRLAAEDEQASAERRLATLIQDAVAREHELADTYSQYWINRLARAEGHGLRMTYNEWRRAGRER